MLNMVNIIYHFVYAHDVLVCVRGGFVCVNGMCGGQRKPGSQSWPFTELRAESLVHHYTSMLEASGILFPPPSLHWMAMIIDAHCCIWLLCVLGIPTQVITLDKARELSSEPSPQDKLVNFNQFLRK